MKIKTVLKVALFLAPVALFAGLRMNHNQTVVRKNS